MLRRNNSYIDYVKFLGGRESSLGDKSVRISSNIARACTSPSTVSFPQGYNYQYAISMSRVTGYKIATLIRGEGSFTVSSQVVYEKGAGGFIGEGFFTANSSSAEHMEAVLNGEGTMFSEAISIEANSAIFDAGSRPSAMEIAQEVQAMLTPDFDSINDNIKKAKNQIIAIG